jgi:hypothetical protein
MRPTSSRAASLAARQRRAVGRRWAMVDEVHGAAVREVRAEHVDPATWSPTIGEGDVLFTASVGPAIGIWAGDCAALVLVGADGGLVGVHAGWRGLAAGVVDVACDVVRRRGQRILAAVVGPVIHPCCYAFGAVDLDAVASGVGASGPDVAGRTRSGSAALDVPTAIAIALRRHGVELAAVGSCTGCDTRYFSHRRRGEVERHAVVAWATPGQAA